MTNQIDAFAEQQQPPQFSDEPIISFTLKAPTPNAWTQCVLEHFDVFLLDHAACEKKAAGMAVSMISHYPDQVELVKAMADVAVEEMSHFREVIRLIQKRGLMLTKDEKDPYIAQLRAFMLDGRQAYFLDRLLMAAIVEARGAERFSLLAQALSATATQDKAKEHLYQFYQALATSEARHYMLFLQLANLYFTPAQIRPRLEQWLVFEADHMAKLIIRPALH